MDDFLDDVGGGLVGDILREIFLKPLHWIAWATGVALATLGSFGRFQIEPFNDDEWLPEEGRPVLRTFGATFIGCGVWAIAIAALIREFAF